MNNGFNNLRSFGKFRLDAEKKVLWFDQEPVDLPLKEIELLCLLTENSGQLLTKEQILNQIWADSFVEENNLSRHIYRLRKLFAERGESAELIQTVPRRGYRFNGQVHQTVNRELVIEKHSFTQTLIEELENSDEPNGKNSIPRPNLVRYRKAAIFFLIFIALIFGLNFYRQKPSLSSSIKSIAVLPFKTIAADKENSHQGLGLADILITRLSNIKEITVRPTSTVMMFEDYQEDSIGIGQKLQVDAVLEGTIHRTGDKVRVTARLIKVSDNSSVWAEQFEKAVGDEFRLQNEISWQLVDALALNLSGQEKNALTKRYTESADAYQLYVKGRYEWNKRSPAGMQEAERLFRNAIEKDPNFVLAYVGLADRLAMEADSTGASTAINKALELDPNLAEAYASAGFINIFHTWKWQLAEVSFKKSIELNPGYATAHHWYAELLTIQGRHQEAKAEIQRALEINPLSHNFLADLGQIHYFAHEYDQAEKYCRKALEIYPEFLFAHGYLASIYLQQGNYDQAVDEYLKFSGSFQTYPNQTEKVKKTILEQTAEYRASYQKGGIRKFLEHLISLNEKSGPGFYPNTHYQHAIWHSFLGNKEKALDHLEKAYQGGAFFMVFVKADPVFDSLRSEPRYQELLRKMDLL